MLEIDQLKKTRLIDIRANHTDPAVATKVVNAVADAFALWNLEVKTKTNTIAGTYLQKRIAELERIVGQKQLELDFLNKLIEIGSKELEFDFKKNFSPKLSNGTGSANDPTDTG